MDRSGPGRVVRGATVALLFGLALAMIATLRTLPRAELVASQFAWLPAALAGALVVAAASATLAELTVGLRHRSVSALLRGGSSASLAGGAIGLLAGAQSLAVPLLGAAILLLGSSVASRARALDPIRARVAAVATMALAEGFVIVELVPATADLAAPLRPAILGSVVAVAALIVLGTLGRATMAAFVGVGAAALLTARGGSFEAMVGLAALFGSQLLGVRDALEATPESAEDEELGLPALAEQLSEAVMRFDGRLQLREWNSSAAGLLGLDAASAGARIEDLLGVSISELPGGNGSVVSRGVVGGLEIAMHRSGAGLTAVIRDPGATPEADRLGRELRTTIEELLRARRTIDLQRGELERASTVDPLTGVASRGAILERLRMEVAQARRYRHPVTLVLLDIDGFGELNREHGITGGDTVLREVALRVRLRVREADALGRAGSDGFMAVLPHTDEAGGATFADALRHRLALRPVSIGDASAQVTISIGVATMRPGEDLDADGLLSRVEEALTSAQRAGGDRIALDRLHGLARLEDPHHAASTAEREPTEDAGA